MIKNRFIPIQLFIGFIWICILIMMANALFIFPSADDYSYYLGQQQRSFVEFQKWHYNNWGGRYIPNMILGSFSFEGLGLWLYRFLSVSMILGLYTSIFIFVKRVLKITDSFLHQSYITCILFITYTLSLYSISQQFYWLSGSITYNLGIIFCLLSWSYFDIACKNLLSLLGVIISVFILNGTNEIVMLLFNISLVIYIFYALIIKKNIHPIIYAIIIFSFICCLIALLAPGNTIRSESAGFINTKNPIFTISRAVFRSSVFLWEHFYTVIFALLAIYPYLDRTSSRFQIAIPNHLILWVKWGIVLFPFIILFIGTAPSYWATGRIPPQRTANVISFFFFCASIFSLLFYRSNFSAPKINEKVLMSIPLMILLTLLLLPNFMIMNIKDFVTGKTYEYNQKMKERIIFLKNTPKENVEVQSIPIPKGIIFGDLEEDSTHFHNKAVAEYYGKKSIVLKKIKL